MHNKCLTHWRIWGKLYSILFYFIFYKIKPCVLTWMENKLVSADSNPTFKTNYLTLSLFASWVSLCVWLAEGTAHRRREVLKRLIGALFVWLISNRKCTASPQALSSVSRGEECWVRFNYHSIWETGMLLVSVCLKEFTIAANESDGSRRDLHLSILLSNATRWKVSYISIYKHICIF